MGANSPSGGSIDSEKIAIFQQFQTLVKNAEYAFSTKNDVHSNANKRVGGRIDWDCFVALAKIGDEKYPVVFKIRTIDNDIRSQIYEMATKKEADGSHDHGQQNKPLDALSDYGVVPSTSNGEIVSQDGDSVKRSDSDIAQIESVISEASRDKEEMYSDFDGQEAPKNVQQEIKFSTSFNEEYMDAAIARNEKLGNVDAGLLNQAAKDRAAVAKLMRQLQADKKIGLPEDILGNTFFADSSYGGSEENTTICPRSLASEAFMDAVSDYIGRPLTVAEQIYISQDLQGRTATPECLYCYVATDRKAYREFLGRYIQQRDDVLGKIKAGQSDMEKLYQEFLDGPSWMVTNTPYCAGG